jgi:hypothetical protein
MTHSYHVTFSRKITITSGEVLTQEEIVEKAKQDLYRFHNVPQSHLDNTVVSVKAFLGSYHPSDLIQDHEIHQNITRKHTLNNASLFNTK